MMFCKDMSDVAMNKTEAVSPWLSEPLQVGGG